jgi:hypothetical protein
MNPLPAYYSLNTLRRQVARSVRATQIVHDNQEVKAGDLLFEIDPADYKKSATQSPKTYSELKDFVEKERPDWLQVEIVPPG